MKAIYANWKKGKRKKKEVNDDLKEKKQEEEKKSGTRGLSAWLGRRKGQMSQS